MDKIPDPATLLVTTGATITFHALLESILSQEFLNALLDFQISHITIQFGNEAGGKSVQAFEKLLRKLVSQLGPTSKFAFVESTVPKQGIYSHLSLHKFDRLTIRAFAFTSDINRDISSAKYVISHAGTGAILDTLRLPPVAERRLVVVNNSTLMGNHQLEIGNAFAALDVLLFVENCSTPGILKQLERCVRGEWVPKELDNGNNLVMGSIIQEEMSR